jgi:hypothetical protein
VPWLVKRTRAAGGRSIGPPARVPDENPATRGVLDPIGWPEVHEEGGSAIRERCAPCPFR